MQFEGEVELCDDSFHSPNAQQIRDEWRNKPARNEIERASGRRFGE